jgi:antitoxin component YwqK of YwqJK toxin-antitoxin module/serine/threonine protein kinase
MAANHKVEERVDEHTKVKTRWVYQECGKPVSYEEFSAQGTLLASRTFDDNGEESEYRGYSASGVMLHRALFSGPRVKRFKWTARGQLLEEAEYLNNYKHGVISQYSETTGRLVSRIEYKDDRLHGLKEIYFETPGRETIRERAHYVSGRLEGEFSKFYSSGQVQESGFILNGKREGEHKRFYENGKLQSITRYRDGQMNGDMEEYREDGSLKRRYPTKNGKAHGIEECFNEIGKLTSRSAHVDGEFTNDFSQFEQRSDQPLALELFYPGGALRSRETYLSGLRNGSFEEFYSDGKVRCRGAYANDKYFGPISYFDSEGRPTVSTCYKDGIKDGPSVSYFESGEIASVVNYLNGDMVGSRYYYENGQLKTSVDCEPESAGMWRQYSDRGILLRECQVKPNWGHTRFVRHGKDLIYDEKGNLEIEAEYQSDIQNGITRYYWPTGGIQFQQEFEKGRILTLEEFTRDGQMRRQAVFMPDGSLKSEKIFDVVERDPTKEPLWEPGTEIDGYRILRAIGHGGMGDVYLAEEIELKRRVAIKTIRGHATESARSRFVAEGKALAKIKHPNVVSIHTVGNHSGTPYMVMEYIEGWALYSLLGQGMLSLGEQIRIFRQMVLGVQAAHDATVLHRDLKPTNVIVSRDFHVKIIDFGIAKILDDSQGYKTETGVIVGTVRYLAPEIAKGMPPSVQTDIYGLGIVFYEMLTGDSPYRADNKLEMLEKIKSQPLEFPDGISEILPDGLKLLVAKMMAKAVEDRQVNLHQVLKELDAISFDEIPPDLMAPTPPGLEIANLDEVRKQLKERGLNESEFSLILNLASRIQHRMAVDPDATAAVGRPEELVISPAALNEATERFERAKRDVQNSRSKKSN